MCQCARLVCVLSIALAPGDFPFALCPLVAVAVKVDVVHRQCSSVAFPHRIVVWRSVQHRDGHPHGVPLALAHSQWLGDYLFVANFNHLRNQYQHPDTLSIHVDNADAISLFQSFVDAVTNYHRQWLVNSVCDQHCNNDSLRGPYSHHVQKCHVDTIPVCDDLSLVNHIPHADVQLICSSKQVNDNIGGYVSLRDADVDNESLVQ